MKRISSLLDVLPPVLCAVNGPGRLTKGEDAKVLRPSTITPVIPLGSTAPSCDMKDYLGGFIRTGYHKKKKRFWIPLVCVTVLIAPNVPLPVICRVIEDSPLSIPILASPPKKGSDRPILSLDEEGFSEFDPEMLQDLEQKAPLVHAQLELFFDWLIEKKGRLRAWRNDAAQFYPTARNGRFRASIQTDEIRIKAAALSLFKQWVFFASKEMNWLSAEEANKYLLSVWRSVLPESAPGLNVSNGPEWSDLTVFWTFTRDYIETHLGDIAKPDMPRTANTVAAIHRLPDGETYLVFPRTAFLLEYSAWICRHNGSAIPQEGRWEAKVQGKIISWGVQLKVEKKGEAWRYDFYDNGQAPEGEKEKQACLAFPVWQLPSEITDILKKQFGSFFGKQQSSDSAVVLSESDQCAEKRG